METTQTMPEWRAAADEIWAVLRETALRQAETEHIMKQNAEKSADLDKKFDRIAKENAERSADLDKKFDRIAKENAERSVALDKKFDRLGLNVGGLNRSLGELIETLIAARLWEKFPEHGFARAYRRVPVYDETNRVRTDIDILLSDTDRVMAVEVKHELDRLKDVEEHLKRMELIRNYPPAETVSKQLLGAMAGGNVAADVTGAAYEAGFYVLELTGDSVRLVPPPAGFKPRQW